MTHDRECELTDWCVGRECHCGCRTALGQERALRVQLSEDSQFHLDRSTEARKRLAEITHAIGYDPAWMQIAGDCNPVAHAVRDLVANYQQLVAENAEQAKRIEAFEESSAMQSRCIDRWVKRYDTLVVAIRERARATCLACLENVPFVTNVEGKPLRPRGHVHHGYCRADALHDVLATQLVEVLREAGGGDGRTALWGPTKQ